MIKKSKNIINFSCGRKLHSAKGTFLYPLFVIIGIIIVWQAVVSYKIVDAFLLPSPVSVIKAVTKDFPLLMMHSGYTLTAGITGLLLSVITAYIIAVIMDRFSFLNKAVYPILVISQTVPAIAIAPLLVLWLGYGLFSKTVLVMMTCFFPLTISILEGFKSADTDAVDLLKSMGATKNQILYHIKLPESLSHFFAGLKVSVSYSVVSAVIAEWIGGTVGLGVYMTRVKKSYSFDKMFGVVLIIVIISIILIEIVKLLEKRYLKRG